MAFSFLYLALMAATSCAPFAVAARLVTPRTLLRWHRALVRRKWRQPAGGLGVRRCARGAGARAAARRENPRWGYRRICGELAKLGLQVSPTSIRRLLARRDWGRPRGGRAELARVPARAGGEHRRLRLLHVESMLLRRYYVLFFIEHGSRRVRLAGCTDQPDRRLGHPAGAQPRPRLRRAATPLPDPRPRQQVQRPLRRGLSQRTDPDPRTPIRAPKANASPSGSSAPSVPSASTGC